MFTVAPVVLKYLFVVPSGSASVFIVAPLVVKYLFVVPCAKSSVVLPENNALASMVKSPVPELKFKGVVALKCALTSLGLGPVYVNTPVGSL